MNKRGAVRIFILMIAIAVCSTLFVGTASAASGKDGKAGKSGKAGENGSKGPEGKKGADGTTNNGKKTNKVTISKQVTIINGTKTTTVKKNDNGVKTEETTSGPALAASAPSTAGPAVVIQQPATNTLSPVAINRAELKKKVLTATGTAVGNALLSIATEKKLVDSRGGEITCTGPGETDCVSTDTEVYDLKLLGKKLPVGAERYHTVDDQNNPVGNGARATFKNPIFDGLDIPVNAEKVDNLPLAA